MLFKSSAGLATALLSLSGFVAAVPAQEPNTLRLRDVQSPIAGLPGCSKEAPGDPSNEDPSYAVGSSRFKDGEGKYIGSDCDKGHRGDKCWTDYYLVGTQLAYTDWEQVMGHIQCDGNDDGAICSQQVSSELSKCESTTWGASASISGEASVIFGTAGFEITTTFESTHESCSSNTTTQACTWNDNGCHSIWAAQMVTTAYGYKRRSCVEPSSGNVNMPNSPKRGDGFYTRGMMDFSIPLPKGPGAISCKGTCKSDYNPGDMPKMNEEEAKFKYF